MRCSLAILSLALCLGCSREPAGHKQEGPDLRLAVVTDLEGYLEPCGCTSNPLGGIDRLAAQVRTLRKEGAPVLVLVAGDTFFDTPEVPAARVDQAKRNAETLVRILDRLKVDALLPGSRDRAQPAATLARLEHDSSFPWLAMKSEIEVRQVRAGGLTLAIVGARRGATRQELASAVEAATDSADMTLVLVDGSRREANRAGGIKGVDFVVQGGLDEDAALPPHPAGRSWALHAGRQGKGLTVVDIYWTQRGATFLDQSEWSRQTRAAELDHRMEELSSKIARWERDPEVDRTDLQVQRRRLEELRRERSELQAPADVAVGNRFVAKWIPLPKAAPRDEEVATLMRHHDKAVNEANRVAFANLKPPPLEPGDVAYVGSQACSACHQEAYAWWRNHAHGKAYRTLQERDKQYNLDCVGCHVTGYEEPGGSTVTHNLDGALVNVGCESCHGPGAAHVSNPEVQVVRDTPESVCVQCHNSEHSDLFDYQAYRKTLIVPGHGLPSPER